MLNRDPGHVYMLFPQVNVIKNRTYLIVLGIYSIFVGLEEQILRAQTTPSPVGFPTEGDASTRGRARSIASRGYTGRYAPDR